MFEELIASIDAESQALEDRANDLMENYWAWFQPQCKSVWAAIAVGEDVKPGKLAPVIERKKSGETVKRYFRWKLFGGDNLRKKNKSISMGIAPAAAEDHTKQIKLNGTWEIPRALELEKQLMPIRMAIQGLHEARVRLVSAERRVNRLSKGDTK